MTKVQDSELRIQNNPRKQEGFTLIELIVAFTIIAILSVISVAAYVSFSRNQAVDNEVNQLVSVLNLAKSKAQSQVKPSSCATSPGPTNQALTEYQVVIDQSNSRYKLVAICAGSPIDIPIEGSSIIYHKFPSQITVNTNNTISFNVLSGVATSGTITLTGKWVGSPDILRTITINTDGTIQ